LIVHWTDLGKTKKGQSQRSRYQNLFRNLVEENYIQKIRQYLGGDHHIHFVSEKANGDKVTVYARILKTDVDVHVEFETVKSKGGWRVVDVRLDDISLQETYRSSFNRIIR